MTDLSKRPKPISTDELKRAKAKVASSPIPEPPKAPKAKKLRDCVCGCGTQTGGLFAPGHDARLHAWQKRIKADPKLEVPKVVIEALKRWEAAVKERAERKAANKAKQQPKVKAA